MDKQNPDMASTMDQGLSEWCSPWRAAPEATSAKYEITWFQVWWIQGWLDAVEDFPAGYPRFSALISSHDSFHICRRFSNLRARLLLLQQDRLSLLEKRLEKVDREEVTLLSLGSSRRDTNKDRGSILEEIDAALADYGIPAFTPCKNKH
jgi:hypothetical protein